MTSLAENRIWLECPDDDTTEPHLSIVIPAMNEELTIGDFVDWCKDGLKEAGVAGEILIVDSSSDRTSSIALAHGARVLHVPKRGLGHAYIDAIPYIRGEWILMGDADCTYDFRQLTPFVEKFKEGFEYVMGSRWAGSIEKGSMPPHHQYFGTPFTTWILNRLYSATFSDIHCGMRGITKTSLITMDLQSKSWEYASEMVLKSVHMNLKTAEVPVHFLKDRDGRLSHHKREGWFSPFKAAWINLRAMFIYGADFFAFGPGCILFALGISLVLPLTFGSATIGAITFSLYWQLLGVVFTIVGSVFLLGTGIARVLFDYTGKGRRRWLSLLSYTRSIFFALGITVFGILLVLPLLRIYVKNDLNIPINQSIETHLAITGLLLVLLGPILFIFTLLTHAASLATRYNPKETK